MKTMKVRITINNGGIMNQMIEIKSWLDGKVLFSAECSGIKECLEMAVKEGKDLSCASLNRASLDGASLDGASLNRASLNGASLNGASLNGASLNGASLNCASLNDASLNRASLNRAGLDGASLNGASLNGASLNGASLNCARNFPKICKVDGLFTKIKAQIDGEGSLNMDSWHTCETTHCIAGWAVVLAGDAGRVAENLWGTDAAGALIILESCPYLSGAVPNFTSSNEEGMKFIEECAKKEGEIA